MLDQLITLSTALLLALLATAVISDTRSHRIPNWAAGGIFLLGALIQCANSGWVGLTTAAMGVLVALFFFLPFYARQAMGAGDVKLMAGLGAWLGPVGAGLGCAVTLVAGAALAVVALVCRAPSADRPTLTAVANGIPQNVRASLAVEKNGQLKVPYALAIATGSLASAWYLDKLSAVFGLAN